MCLVLGEKPAPGTDPWLHGWQRGEETCTYLMTSTAEQPQFYLPDFFCLQIKSEVGGVRRRMLFGSPILMHGEVWGWEGDVGWWLEALGSVGG